ncbi:growth factor receptor domain-containing protein [Flagelloscypha sp. PMI_526]|nr:growth factor receptor domain-containing protein [Flagelloscypha sp. PMI_526]
MFLSLAALGAALSVVYAQGPAAVVCTPGQCLQGFSNITLGAQVSAPQSPLPVLLLPGQYTTTTNPQLLHDVLTSSSMTMKASAGFNSSQALPMDLQLTPGIAVYASKLYGGQSAFQGVPSTPSNSASSTPLNSPGSIAIAQNVWASVHTTSNVSFVLWESIPDVGQLPSTISANVSSLALKQFQSSQCSPPCSSSGICTASGTCACAPNFTGSSCEQCADGFFGPSCQACPSGCTKCDQGVTGSGQCLDASQAKTSLETCNCLNGQCAGAGGSCTCSAGWTTGDNVCSIGCSTCSDTTGECTACKSGFSLDPNDKTKCNHAQSTDNTGALCPEGSFSPGTSACTPCDPACKSCSGTTANDCIQCAANTYLFNGQCVSADSKGSCQTGGGPQLIADNNKGQCDGCPALCASCEIPNFTRASTSNQVQCTQCLPGAFLLQGKCVNACPSGMFADGASCSSCDPSCGTCSGSAKFCLTCPSSQLAFNGTCVSSCPSGSSQATGSSSCTTCHPDCATCSGGAINQCSSCPPETPVLVNGRCLATCTKGQFFDPQSSSCKGCDSSCSSCSGPSSQECLACSSPTQVLRAGKCVQAPCTSGAAVVAGLGACLNELVVVPQASGTSSGSPLPSITARLEWWQILLMALGCAFIFVVIVLIWRRRMRRKRQWETKVFASKRNLGQGFGWTRMKLGWLGLIGRGRSQKREMELADTKRHSAATRSWYSQPGNFDVEQARRTTHYEDEKMDIIDGYYAHAGTSRHSRMTADRLTRSSVYSELTGQRRNAPEPRQPVRDQDISAHTRVTAIPPRRSPSWRQSHASSRNPEPLIKVSAAPQSTWQPPPSFLSPRERAPSPAQKYADALKPSLSASPPLPGTAQWLSMAPEQPLTQYSTYPLQQQTTGSSTVSKNNPFRQAYY